MTTPASSLAQEILATNPQPSSKKAPYGFWGEPAIAVDALVKEGFPVSEAVRIVLAKLDRHGDADFGSLRSAYYAGPRKNQPVGSRA